MKKFLSLLALLAVTSNATAATTVRDLVNLGMVPSLAAAISAITIDTAVLSNNTYITANNAAASGTLNLLKADASDNTILNAKTAKNIQLAINSVADTTLAAGTLTFATAAEKIIPGATSLTFRNNANSADNLAIVDAGTATFRDTVTSTGLLFPTANEEVVAGAGTTVADATAMSATKHVHQLTGANGTVGWKFPSATAGQMEFLLNTTAGVPKIYAVSGGTCNGGAADAACTLVTGIVSHICYATAANTWICS